MTREPSFDQRVTAYLDDEITPEQFDLLSAELERDAELRKRFLKLGVLDDAIRQAAENRDRQDTIEAVLGEADQGPEEGSIFEFHKTLEADADKRSDGSLRAGELFSLAGYLAVSALKDPRVVKGLVAAALVLLAVLVIVLIGPGEEPAAPETAGIDTLHSEAVDAPVQLVATLTGERDAVWDARQDWHVHTGDRLAVGQRLFLTEGFAEITTDRGAVAVLEAPAEVEILDDNNALHLHRGRLVGACLTAASKGFTVKTDYAVIVDLGTEFGVEVARNEVAATVFTGEVEVLAPGGKPHSITANQTITLKIDGINRSFVIEDLLAEGFDTLLDMARHQTVRLPGTGRGLAVGQGDPNWQIIAVDGMPLGQPLAATVADPSRFTTTVREGLRYMTNEPGVSQWVTPFPQSVPRASVQYQTAFDVSGFDRQTLALELRFLADNHVRAIRLNGRPIGVPPHGKGPVFAEMSAMTIREGFVDGVNTLTFKIERYQPGNRTNYWTGMRVELELTSRRLWAGPSE